MAQSLTERVREMQTAVRVLETRDQQREQDVSRLITLVESQRVELAASRQEDAVLRQRMDDQTKRADVWAGRAWALVTVLVGARLSLASGLIVTLARK